MNTNLKISIVIPVLNSQKVVIRQLRWFKSMKLKNNVEILFIDDGSNHFTQKLRFMAILVCNKAGTKSKDFADCL